MKNLSHFDDMQAFRKHTFKKIGVSQDTNIRLFGVKGEEYYDYDSLKSLKQVESLYFSYGEDFNYKIRLETLEYRKDLGEGGFGTV